MDRSIKPILYFLITLTLLVVVTSCDNKDTKTDTLALTETETATEVKPKAVLSKAFNDYWYNGTAEITSYQLEQARYGEIRNGKAVLVYVTEDFLPDVQVKADSRNPNNVSVLKLNATKNFNTGIYPYSIMQSTFFPVANNQHAIKVSSSMQEWCGHVYTQLNNREQFEITSHSYFQGEADQNLTLDKAITENELWNQLRINPSSLPTGEVEIIPSLEYIRFRHIKIKAYKATASLNDGVYEIEYPELNRTLKISFNSSFPYDISGWEEQFKSGFGPNAKTLTTKATRLESIRSAYWGKNSNADEALRAELKLQ